MDKVVGRQTSESWKASKYLNFRVELAVMVNNRFAYRDRDARRRRDVETGDIRSFPQTCDSFGPAENSTINDKRVRPDGGWPIVLCCFSFIIFAIEISLECA